ncbi:hypothetical protein HMPREF9120_01399 [Neisseria sp. oral taxon 020 str. F0370]|nr:hypothetical protein HMPREF9120_01399 [Neisseria sp. oral taxon 020 str. F0370]
MCLTLVRPNPIIRLFSDGLQQIPRPSESVFTFPAPQAGRNETLSL